MNAAPRAPAPQRAIPLRFTKMHGAGNDFVVLDLRDGAPPPDASQARALADRHAGVGCDQILTIERATSPRAVAGYSVWNADGSPAEQCGNGARCIAAWLLRDGAARPPRFALDGPAGEVDVECLPLARYALAMGVPVFAPARVPYLGVVTADGCALELDSEALRFDIASMGNPHAVITVDSVAAAPVERIGRALQARAEFPQSVNVGFAEIVARGRIRLRVYERGVGETQACGSGACAAAAVLMRRGLVDRAVEVALPGGTLRVEWPRDDAAIRMSGPAVFVFDGEFTHDR